MSSPNLTLTGGNFQNGAGAVVAGGILLFELSHDSEYATGSSQIVAGQKFTVTLNSTGDIPASPAFKVYDNSSLLPSGSYYTVRLFDSTGSEIWASPQYWVLSSTPNPLNVGTVVPANPPGAGLSGTVSTLLLQTNGTNNGDQSLLNLVSGSNVTLADNGSGNVTISAGGGIPTPDTARFGMISFGLQITSGTPAPSFVVVNEPTGGLTGTGQGIDGNDIVIPSSQTLPLAIKLRLLNENAGGQARMWFAGNWVSPLRKTVCKMPLAYSTSNDATAGCALWGISNPFNGTSGDLLISGAITDGVFLGVQKVLSSGNGNWKLFCFSSSVSTIVDTGIPVVANQRYAAEFIIQSGIVTAFINGTLVATCSTHVPIVPLSLAFMGGTTATSTNSQYLTFEYLYVENSMP